jgi:hypothetical protein
VRSSARPSYTLMNLERATRLVPACPLIRKSDVLQSNYARIFCGSRFSHRSLFQTVSADDEARLDVYTMDYARGGAQALSFHSRRIRCWPSERRNWRRCWAWCRRCSGSTWIDIVELEH